MAIENVATFTYYGGSPSLHLVEGQIPQASETVHSANQLERRGGEMGRRRDKVHVVPAPGKGIEASATVIISCTEATHACGQDCRLGSDTETSSLAR